MGQSFQPALTSTLLPEGTLFYIVGASDANKAGLLRYARAQLKDNHLIVFAHRYVTRSFDTGRDDEIRLSNAEFALRERHGLYAMSWESGGLSYGIGTEINYWLARGLSVVVKGSRAYLGQALRCYPDMTVIWVAADAEAAARTRRAREFHPQCVSDAEHLSSSGTRTCGSRVVRIGSSGTSLAGEKLVSVLTGKVI